MSEQPAETQDPQAQLDDIYAVNPDFVRDVRTLLDRGASDGVRRLVLPLHAADIADLIDLLPRDERTTLLDCLGDDLDPEVLTEVEESVLMDLLPELAPSALARAVTELDTDDGVFLVDHLDEDRREEILRAVPAPDRIAVQEALDFPEDSAGRLMQRDFIAVPAYWTVGQVIDYCRDTEDLPDEFYSIFVIDPRYRPIGHVPLNRVLRTRRPVVVRQIMEEETQLIPLEMDQEEVAFLFQQYDLASAPVVDEYGRLAGAITFDDVADVIEEEAEEDLLRLGGVAGESDLYDTVMRTTRTRFTWLLVNLGTAIVASLVIALFDTTIDRIVALAILMPIVASMGGNAGTQTLTVAVRALATHELTPTNAMRIVVKEVLVGGLNGIFFAVLMGVIAGLWFGDPMLGGVIAAAMVINLLVAGLFGTLIPLGCQRMGVDPAIAASVFLTTITDVVGFFAFLGLAALVLI